jgi:hypothetical protein
MNPATVIELAQCRVKLAESIEAINARDVEVSKKLSTATAFNGHICDLPTTERTKEGQYWQCSCRQYWAMRVESNIRKWRMFGSDSR